jgi:hypothetical protein
MTSPTTEPRPNGLFKLAPTAAILGEIITWNAAGIAISHRLLVEALRDRGLDETVARELAPRHAFTRACKKLAENRIIRQVDEDEAVIRFQFTPERKAGDHFQYDLETMLSLEKASGRVSCDLPGLATLAQEALDECLGVRTGSDITRVIQRLFERQADLFPIREQGGCYFVPAEYRGFVDRIAQLVVQRVEVARFVEVDELPESERGTGGHGSTGGHASTGGPSDTVLEGRI